MTDDIISAVTNKSVRRRKPHARGLVVARQLIESIALQIHDNEMQGAALNKLSSISALEGLIAVQRLVYAGADEEPLSPYYNLAQCHADRGEHDQAIAVLLSLKTRRSAQLGSGHIEIAKLLRLLACSYEKLGRADEAVAARQQAEAIVHAIIGDSAVVAVLTDLIADRSHDPKEDWAKAFATDTSANAHPGVKPKRGQIWWVKFPQYPSDPHQPRPAIVVSSDGRNEHSNKVQVVPLSSKQNGHPMNYEMPRGHSGLPYDGVAKCGDLTAVDKVMLVKGPVGATSKEVVDAVVALAQRALR